jgi:hypothetical protein
MPVADEEKVTPVEARYARTVTRCGDEGEEPEEDRRRSQERRLGLLPLGLSPQVSAHLVEPHFSLPARNEPREALLHPEAGGLGARR